MKVRYGFVSNSSSSSFVILVAKERHEEVLKSLSKNKYVDIFDKLYKTERKAFGKEVFEIEYVNSYGEGTLYDILCEEEDEEVYEKKYEGYEDILCKYISKLEEDENTAFIVRTES